MDIVSSDDHYLPTDSSNSEADVKSIPAPKQKKRGRSTTATSAAPSVRTQSSSRIVPDFTRPLKRRRATGDCPPAYRSAVADFSTGADELSVQNLDQPFETSYVGISKWTASDKSVFFEALDACGRDNVKSIATRMRTKSEIEVEQYIQLLQHECDKIEGVTGTQVNENPEVSLGAVEIPQYVELLLDQAAEQLEAQDLHAEEELERARFGMVWRLDDETAGAITYQNYRMDKVLQPMDKFKEKSVRALELFDLPMLLKLSRNYFMASEDPEWNYMTYSSTDEVPSIRLSALTELYEMLKDFTELLVVTTHQCAHSRRRAMGERVSSTYKNGLPPPVRKRDVEAAVNILRLRYPQLKSNIGTYWRDFHVKLSSEAASSLMRMDQTGDSELESQSLARWRSESVRKYSSASVASGDASGPKSQSSEESDEGEVTYEGDSVQTLSEDHIQRQIEGEMEKADMRATRIEESRMLHVVGLNKTKYQGKSVVPSKIPAGMTNQLSVTQDWRSELRYETVWERFPGHASALRFADDSSVTSEALSDDLSDGAVPSSPVIRRGIDTDSDNEISPRRSLTNPAGVSMPLVTSHQTEAPVKKEEHKITGSMEAPLDDESVSASSSNWSSHDPDSPTHQAYIKEED